MGCPRWPICLPPPAIAPVEFGKWHVGDNYPYRPQDRGFQQSMWFPSSHIPSAPDYWRNTYFDTWLRHEDGEIRQSKGYITDVLFDEAMHWISRAQSGRPAVLRLPAAERGPRSAAGAREVSASPMPTSRPAFARFFGMMANIDENMGRLDRDARRARIARQHDSHLHDRQRRHRRSAGLQRRHARRKKWTSTKAAIASPASFAGPAESLGKPRDIGQLTEAQDIVADAGRSVRSESSRGVRTSTASSLAGLLRGKEKSLADRMLVVQYSRMHSQLPVKGDAAVLWDKWRLVDQHGTLRHRRRSGPNPRRGGRTSRRRPNGCAITTTAGGPRSSPA